MPNNSSTGGYLAPVGSPDYDIALEDIFHDAIAGITGLSNDLVRPRWTPEPLPRPDFGTNWVAFGITTLPSDTFAYQGFHPTDGQMELQRDELLRVLHSFYGPACDYYASILRDGLAMGQNREALAVSNINLVEVQDFVNLPALLKEKWVKRVDVPAVYRRRISRRYPILTVQSGQAELDNERYLTPIVITP